MIRYTYWLPGLQSEPAREILRPMTIEELIARLESLLALLRAIAAGGADALRPTAKR